nr:Transposon Tf2-2 polyprotein [Ipomoea batatas]
MVDTRIHHRQHYHTIDKDVHIHQPGINNNHSRSIDCRYQLHRDAIHRGKTTSFSPLLDHGSNLGTLETISLKRWIALRPEVAELVIPELWARVKQLEIHVHTLKEAARDDIETLREENDLLKPSELRRQNVKDLSSSIAAVDGLVDFKTFGPPKKNGGQGRTNPGQSIDGKFSSDGNKGEDKNQKGCWTCGGDHLQRNCPKGPKVAAITEENAEGGGSAPMNCSPMQLLSTINTSTHNNPNPRLMYVDIFVNGVTVLAMVDTGASHNFVDERLVSHLNLNLEQNTSKIKTVNATARGVTGRAEVTMKVDDFDLILGCTFFVAAKAAVIPHFGGIMIHDERSPSFVKADIPKPVVEVLEEFKDVMPSEFPKRLPPRRDLKLAVSLEPVLRLPDFSVPFEVQSDASDRSISGVLVQDDHPIAFESRKLKDCEQRYNVHDKEMTAVVHCLEVWRHYLLGTRFIVITDNVANTYFKSQKTLSPKQARWLEFIDEFDFDWVHRIGRHNAVADALSRKVVEEYLVQIGMVELIREQASSDRQYV